MHKVIGLIGGMGPEATILMMSRLLAATPASDDADHIPLLVDSNTRVPSRIAHLIDGTGEDPTPVLVSMAEKLAASGADVLAMPCNTAHSYYPAIAAAVRIPVLNMVDLTARQVAAQYPTGPVGILASPAVEITGVFAKAFASLGRDAIYPADRDRTLSAIRAIKGGDTDRALPILRAALAELADAGVGVAVIGCSEFSIAAPRLTDAPLPLVDSLDVLVDACVAAATGQAVSVKQGAA
ncbi:aspartate/glutamate racemase family protein [Chachezhania antarctica]|uniref:aspartate/glutamate racemase family protein n=1 Tax=Chachezhania antarctica TaxID=2340860 RepID=UPI000EB12650|nr:amino acid racemase [Chachezhania antarctica]|tara:strand:+ start:6077 stop:6793 length:717 start_codon:yes stop_codon:yes gene_type:complete